MPSLSMSWKLSLESHLKPSELRTCTDDFFGSIWGWKISTSSCVRTGSFSISLRCLVSLTREKTKAVFYSPSLQGTILAFSIRSSIVECLVCWRLAFFPILGHLSATSLMIPSSMCNALQYTQVRWFQRKLLIHLRQRFRRNWTCWMLPKFLAKSRNALEGAYLGSPPSRAGTLSPLETSSRDRFHGSKRQPRLFLMEECSTNSLADYKLARISRVWRNYFLARFVIW